MSTNAPVDLSWYLAELDRFARSIAGAPGWRRVVLVDGLHIDPSKTEGIVRESVREPAAYESRFRELIAAGHPWISMSALGVLGDALVVSVVPSTDTHCTVMPSINLSGPPRFVQQEADWNLSRFLELRD